jgi:hypothetical protein
MFGKASAPKSGAFPGLSAAELVAALAAEPVGAEYALLAGFLKVCAWRLFVCWCVSARACVLLLRRAPV